MTSLKVVCSAPADVIQFRSRRGPAALRERLDVRSRNMIIPQMYSEIEQLSTVDDRQVPHQVPSEDVRSTSEGKPSRTSPKRYSNTKDHRVLKTYKDATISFPLFIKRQAMQCVVSWQIYASFILANRTAVNGSDNTTWCSGRLASSLMARAPFAEAH